MVGRGPCINGPAAVMVVVLERRCLPVWHASRRHHTTTCDRPTVGREGGPWNTRAAKISGWLKKATGTGSLYLIGGGWRVEQKHSLWL